MCHLLFCFLVFYFYFYFFPLFIPTFYSNIKWRGKTEQRNFFLLFPFSASFDIYKIHGLIIRPLNKTVALRIYLFVRWKSEPFKRRETNFKSSASGSIKREFALKPETREINPQLLYVIVVIAWSCSNSLTRFMLQ